MAIPGKSDLGMTQQGFSDKEVLLHTDWSPCTEHEVRCDCDTIIFDRVNAFNFNNTHFKIPSISRSNQQNLALVYIKKHFPFY